MNNLNFNTCKKKRSLSKVLDRLNPYNLKIIVVLEKEDVETIKTIKNKNY